MKNRNRFFIYQITFISMFLVLAASCKESNDTNPPAGNIVTDIDGNVYHTVTIGTQVWMVENLKTTKYNDGTSIPDVTDNTAWYALTSGACCDYNNTSGNSITYGKLYNYFAVIDSRKLCPTGWHIPTDAEWTALSAFLGSEDVAGGKLKEAGVTHWATPNANADNSSNFTALPGGFRNNLGFFASNGIVGMWWSSSEESTIHAWDRDMSNADGKLYRAFNFKGMGISVRCVKD
ncbi:MAG TPA: fibrobacter succinogenes major paralogous domain-containing protein [Paludibacter sp.]|nr:fibrobacter succinogenes major paralogous domain-containing protein [Paludibacter sp.]